MPTFSRRRLLLTSLVHFWKTNVAIVLGVVVAAAVIGGALIVGDSVRASLRQMTLDRLGDIDSALTGHRFFREQLADDLARNSNPVAPAIVLVGGIEHKTESAIRRAGQVNVYGVDSRTWTLIAPPDSQPPRSSGVFLNSSLAAALGAATGDELTIWLELPSAVPRDTLLGKRDNESQEITVTVADILADGPGAPRLGLNPTQQLPMNLFIALETLQDALNLAEIAPTRRDPVGQPARVNTLFTAANGPSDSLLKDNWQLADSQLRLVVDQTLQCLVLESDQMLLDDTAANAAIDSAQQHENPVSPVFVYLVNRFQNIKEPDAFSMYSTVAGLDVLALPDAFGPWEFVGERPQALQPFDVILNEWLAKDLKVQVGDPIQFAYHEVGSHGELPEREATAIVRGIVKMTGAAVDQQLTPTVKGITDADSLDDWEQPFPMDLDKVTDRDDEYWDQHRATPKAFFSMATARLLWPSRYGQQTSVRIAPRAGQGLDDLHRELADVLPAQIVQRSADLAFQPVKQQGLAAANGSTDFTGLFIGFSFFLILAAVILVGLLFRLAVEQRVRQWGLLAAVGLSPRQIALLMLGEGSLLVAIGALLGGFAAVGYAQLMLYGLKTWWIGAIGTKFLILDVQPLSVAIGVMVAALTSLLAIVWALWQLRGISIREQLTGTSEVVTSERPGALRAVRYRAIGTFAAAVALVAGVMTGVVPQREAFSGIAWPAVLFFFAGMLILASGMAALSAWLQSDTSLAVRGRGPAAILRLGLRNASRRRSRSVLTAGLIASAAFVIAAVAAAQKNPAVEQPDIRSGNGGFTLVAESSSPILYNLNTPEGRNSLNITPKTPEQTAALAAMKVYAFRVQPGEDASCLNLYQTRMPTILGTPDSVSSRGGFEFIGGGNEWRKLTAPPQQSNTVPVFGDMNTLAYSLKKGLGDVIIASHTAVPGDVPLQIAAMFDGAVFQGVLLMSEKNFLRLYPERQGYQYFLIEVPPEHAAVASELLETDLSEYGFDAEPVADRLARFLAVQNTYLSTFQSLGGLGLLLGTFGLATVMLRNVLERQSELALLRAVGFRPAQIAGLVLWETALLLGWGLLTGTAAAMLAMLPHLASTGADVGWAAGGLLLGSVAVVGLAASWWAIRAATNLPIVATLRGE